MTDLNGPTDHELIHRGLQGNAAALGQLLARYDRVAFQLALQIVGHREDALDIVQTSFTKAFGALPTLTDRERFGSWLLRIVRNAALDWVAARAHRQHQTLTEAEHAAHEPSALRSMERDEEQARVRDAIAELSAEHQQVLLLRYCDGLDYTSMAKRLGIKVTTVRSRLYEARLVLKNKLDRYLHGGSQ
ncbi:MAG: sigma-70 family RNA polymerase sigma factor [Planctomycetota bacterium]